LKFVSPKAAVPGTHILYWLQSCSRLEGNLALELCVWLSQRLMLPVVILAAAPDTHNEVVADGIGCEKGEVGATTGVTLESFSTLKEGVRETALVNFGRRVSTLGIPLFVFDHPRLEALRVWVKECTPHVVITDDSGVFDAGGFKREVGPHSRCFRIR
jgi:hypothetical protein